MSVADAAAYYYEHRDDPDLWGEQVEAVVSKKPDSVISVRFNSDEITRIRRAADAAGLSLSAFVRRSVPASRSADVLGIDRARRDMAQVGRLAMDALRAPHA